ncbi:SAM hydrolase/SAM-dependent halogenase family protein [Pleionea sediminis]|uniref:SAM hydrolase/SAM-dependent halogenase family protein n=1 Tax=Pleionea sediminis TaxID=2569479 RepID=UPI0011853F92|nr:SAM-dependent chlorinase/fluorinase [Pleionea sediminis]
MANIITLMTDFGSQDGYVGAMMGRLLRLSPHHRIVEITHDIEPQNVWQAAFSLQRYAQEYPDNTVHMVVVDPGVGSERKALALRCDRHWLVGPDNGVLSLAASRYKNVESYQLKSQTEWWKKHTSFDGLALFSPAAACLLNPEIRLEELASPIDGYHNLAFPPAEFIGNKLIGQILSFDRFGNAITNITSADIPKNPLLTVDCNKYQFPIRPFYCEANANNRIAIINSDGYLELAIYQGSVKAELALSIGDSVFVDPE